MFHDYIVQQKIMKNDVKVIEGIKFHLIIPIKGNENAQNAMRYLADSLQKYLQRSGIKLPMFEFQYNGMKNFDTYTEKKVEKDGYSIIPMS